jgi:hypothetical protein
MPTTRVRIRGVRKRRAAPKVGRSTPDSGHSRSVVGGPFCATDRDRGSLSASPLPHHRTYGSVYGGSRG